MLRREGCRLNKIKKNQLGWGISFCIISMAIWIFVLSFWDSFYIVFSYQLIITVSILEVVPLSFGVFMLNNYFFSLQTNKQKNIDKQILIAARAFNGMLTIVGASSLTTFSLDKSKEILDSFVSRNYAKVKISEGGSAWYYFPDIITDLQKKAPHTLDDLLKNA
jgi:hypothetical protein